MKKILFFSLLGLLTIMSSCRDDDDNQIVPGGEQGVTGTPGAKGFYLLNEGGYGRNNASLDLYDAEAGIYYTNIYPERNPNVVKELGDTGNDLQIYKNRLYAVINGSNKVEIMTLDSAKHIADVEVPNCRCICFDDNYAYVTSFTGYVYKIDIVTTEVADSVEVGRQPEEAVVSDGKLYVVNSGGYGDYDNRLSIIDLATFTREKDVEVDINLTGLKADGKGNLYISTPGDYYKTPSNLYVYNIAQGKVTDTLNIAASEMCIVGDSAYVYGSSFDFEEYEYTFNYNCIDLNTKKVTDAHFIPEGLKIGYLYGLYVNPSTREFIIVDALNFTTSGKVYCISPDGKEVVWQADAGVAPSRIAFLP